MITLLRFVPAIVLLAAWQGMVILYPRFDFFLGSPKGIWLAFSELATKENIFHHFAVTGTEAFLGFLAGTILGTLVGVLLSSSDRIYQVSKPYLILLGALPVFALGPMLIFWFGTGLVSKIVLGLLITFSIAVSQSYEGAKQTDVKLIALARTYGANEHKVYWKIVFPSSLIWVLMGIKINIGMALIAAFVGEFISSNAGLGCLIIVAEGLYDVNQIWVGVLLIGLLALLFNFFASRVEAHAKKWQI